MNRQLLVSSLGVLLLGAASTQSLWEPPPFVNWPTDSKPSGSKDAIAALEVASIHVVLEDSSFQSVENRLGGTFGEKGEAGDNRKWLCYYQLQTSTPWVIWLEGGELDDGKVTGFYWQAILSTAIFDDRCKELPKGSKVELPVAIELGQHSAAALAVLGRPGASRAGTLFYSYGQKFVSHGETWMTNNLIAVSIRDDIVEAITALRTTTD